MRSLAFMASPVLFADDKKGAKGKTEKLFNTGAVYGTGKERTIKLGDKQNEKLVSNSVPLKGGRGRKKPKVEKKHIALAARKKQLRKLWGVSSGASPGASPTSSTFGAH